MLATLQREVLHLWITCKTTDGRWVLGISYALILMLNMCFRAPSKRSSVCARSEGHLDRLLPGAGVDDPVLPPEDTKKWEASRGKARWVRRAAKPLIQRANNVGLTCAPSLPALLGVRCEATRRTASFGCPPPARPPPPAASPTSCIASTCSRVGCLRGGLWRPSAVPETLRPAISARVLGNFISTPCACFICSRANRSCSLARVVSC